MRILILLLFFPLLIVGLTQPCWADCVGINKVYLLQLSSSKVLVEIESTHPLTPQVTQNLGYPALWLPEACINPALLDLNGGLKPQAYIRPLPFEVQTTASPAGTWLQILSRSPLEIESVSSDTAFLDTAVSELPLYTQWPRAILPDGFTQEALINEAYQDFEQNRLADAIVPLEGLFESLMNPPKIFYELLGAMYLEHQQWLKAICLYSQGAHEYPDVLGLRYAALLYELHQHEKAAQVLTDMLMSVDIPQDTAAQAQYMLGSIDAENHAFKEALPHLKNASATFETSPVVLYNLGVAYEGTGQKQEAIDTYTRAIGYATGQFRQQIQEHLDYLKSQPL